MDYWDKLDVTRSWDYEEFLQLNPGAKLYFCHHNGQAPVYRVSYERTAISCLEKRAPDSGRNSGAASGQMYPDSMLEETRSLNLSNSVAIFSMKPCASTALRIWSKKDSSTICGGAESDPSVRRRPPAVLPCQRKNEFCAGSLGADDVDILFVGIDNFFTIASPRPVPLRSLPRGGVQFVKPFPDFGEGGRGIPMPLSFTDTKTFAVALRSFHTDWWNCWG